MKISLAVLLALSQTGNIAGPALKSGEEIHDTTSPLVICQDAIEVEYGKYNSVPDLLKGEVAAYDEVDKFDVTFVQTGSFDFTKIDEAQTLSFGCHDKSANFTYKTISVTMKVKSKPVIEGEDYLLYEKGKEEDLTTILNSKIAFHSPVDIPNDCTLEILEDTYSSRQAGEGLFEVKIKVTDSYGNEAYKTLHIIVGSAREIVYLEKKNKGPKLFHDETIIVNYGDYDNVQDLMDDNITAYDEEDESYTPLIQTGSFDFKKINTLQYLSVGSYDSNSVFTYENIPVFITYNVKPVITGVDYIISSEKNPFSVDQLWNYCACYSPSDIPDINLTNEIIYDNYSPSDKTPGIYKITLKSSDQYTNTSSRDFLIIVTSSSEKKEKDNEDEVDEESNQKTLNLTIKRIKNYTSDDLLEYVEENNLYNLYDYDNVRILNSTYEGNSDKNGSYYISLLLQKDDTSDENLTINILVNTPKKNIFTHIGSFFYSIFKKLISIFRR